MTVGIYGYMLKDLSMIHDALVALDEKTDNIHAIELKLTCEGEDVSGKFVFVEDNWIFVPDSEAFEVQI